MQDWVAITGLRAVEPDATTRKIPRRLIDDPDLSLDAKGLYAFVASFQGRPVDPFSGSPDDELTVALAIEELLAAGLIARVKR